MLYEKKIQASQPASAFEWVDYSQEYVNDGKLILYQANRHIYSVNYKYMTWSSRMSRMLIPKYIQLFYASCFVM